MAVTFAWHWCLAPLGILPIIRAAESGSRLATGSGEAIEHTHGDGIDVDKGLLVPGEAGEEGGSGCLGSSFEPGHLSPTGPGGRIKPRVVTENSRKQTEQSAFAAAIFVQVSSVLVLGLWWQTA